MRSYRRRSGTHDDDIIIVLPIIRSMSVFPLSYFGTKSQDPGQQMALHFLKDIHESERQKLWDGVQNVGLGLVPERCSPGLGSTGLTIVKPPFVATLADWGRALFPGGTHKNKTYCEVLVTSPGYAIQLLNRPANSPWVLDYRNFTFVANNAIEIHMLSSPSFSDHRILGGIDEFWDKFTAAPLRIGLVKSQLLAFTPAGMGAIKQYIGTSRLAEQYPYNMLGIDATTSSAFLAVEETDAGDDTLTQRTSTARTSPVPVSSIPPVTWTPRKLRSCLCSRRWRDSASNLLH